MILMPGEAICAFLPAAHRHDDAHPPSGAWPIVERDGAAEGGHPLLHIEEAHAVAGERAVGTPPGAVVLDGQANARRVGPAPFWQIDGLHAEPHGAGLRMLGGVREALLR